MSTTVPSDYNDLLLNLYRLSHELPIDQFQDGALALLKPALPFDSAMWGSATLTASGIDIHTIHLHNQPVEMLQAYEELKHLDTAAMDVSSQPTSTLAFHADSWFKDPSQEPLRDYGRRFGQCHFFISGAVTSETRFTRWLTLFRANSRAYCTEAKRLRLALLMPHFHQALDLSRRVHLQQLGGQGRDAHIGSAIADRRGVLHHMDSVFKQAMLAEWDSWRGQVLPSAVMAAANSALPRVIGRTVVVTLRVEHHLLFIKTRPRCAADGLTPHEFAVAHLMAKGYTHKQIAGLRQRSPSTVRNQIRSLYDKLKVNNVAELIDELRQAE